MAYWSRTPEVPSVESTFQEQPLVLYPSSGSRDSIRLFDLPKELSFAGEKVPLEEPDDL